MPINDDNGRATLASLGTQVSAIDRDYQELKRAVAGLDTKLDTSLSSLASRFDNSIAGLHNKLDAKTTTPWQSIWAAMGVGVGVMVALGTALYGPIRSDTARLDVAVAAIIDKGVFQRQYDADTTRAATERAQLRDLYNGTILARRYDADMARQTAINDGMVSKNAMDQALLGLRDQTKSSEERLRYIVSNFMLTKEFDSQHGDLKTFLSAQTENLQRQITAIALRLNETWSARDALIDLRQRVERVEHK